MRASISEMIWLFSLMNCSTVMLIRSEISRVAFRKSWILSTVCVCVCVVCVCVCV